MEPFSKVMVPDHSVFVNWFVVEFGFGFMAYSWLCTITLAPALVCIQGMVFLAAVSLLCHL